MSNENLLDSLLEVAGEPSTESKGDFSDVVQTVQDKLDEAVSGLPDADVPSDNSSEENVD